MEGKGTNASLVQHININMFTKRKCQKNSPKYDENGHLGLQIHVKGCQFLYAAVYLWGFLFLNQLSL